MRAASWPRLPDWVGVIDFQGTGRSTHCDGFGAVGRSVKLGLIQSEHPMLSFDPDTDGELPTLGMTVSFGGETFTVEDVNPCAMNGTATSAHIRCSR